MANKYKVELTINVDGKGEIRATAKEVENLANKTHQARTNYGQMDRATKAVAGNTKNATSAFAKQAQGMGGLVHIYATVAANVWALTAAFQVLKNASDLRIMAMAAEDLAISTGVNFGAVAKSMQNLTGGALSFTEAMRQANLALSGGATVDQVEQITVIANKAANALGVSVPAAVGRMIQAVTKGEPELVDELGIILRVTRATEEYAQAHNKAVTDLTTFERQQAIINQLLDQGNRKFGDAEIRTNPFEKLIASTADLARTSLKGVTGLIEPIVSTMADNIAIVIAGFGLIAAQITKLILPTLISTREELAKLASIEAQEAAAAFNDIEESQRRLEVTQARITKVAAEQQKFAGIEELFDKQESLLLQRIDKRSRLGQEFTKIVNKGLKEGLSNADISQQLRSSGLLRKLQKELRSDDVHLKSFKKKTTDSVRAAIDDQITAILRLSSAEEKLNNLRKTQSRIIEESLIRAKQQHIATINSLVASSRSQITSANNLTQVFNSLSISIRNINTQYTQFIATQGLMNSAVLRVNQAMKLASVGASALGRVFSLLSGPVFATVTSILFFVEGIKSFLTFTGVLNKAVEEQAEKLSSLSDELEQARRNYSEIARDISTLPSDIEDLSSKWSKVNQVTQQYVKTLQEALENSKELANAGFLDKIFNPFDVGLAPSRSASLIVQTMEELERITNKPIAFDFIVPDAQQRVREFREEIDRTAQALDREIAAATAFGNTLDPNIIDTYTGRMEALKNQIIDLEDGVISVSKDIDTEFLKSLLLTEDAITKMEKAFNRVVKPISKASQESESSAQTLLDAVVNIDRKIFELSQKSETRRILNVDSLIGFRDELNRVKIAFEALTTSSIRSAEKSADAIANFIEIPQRFREAFLGLVNVSGPNVSAEGILALLIRSEEELDRNIDIIRAYKSEVTILTEAEKRLRNERDRGDLQAIVGLYEKGTEQLALQAEHLETQIKITKQQLQILPEAERSASSAAIRALEAQLETVEQLLEARNKEIPLLQKSLAELERVEEVEKAGLSLLKKRADILDSSIEAYKGISDASIITVHQLETQLALSKLISSEELTVLEIEIEKLNTKKELAKVTEDLNKFTRAEEIQLIEKQLEADKIRLNSLAKQKELRLQIIEAEQRSIGGLSDAGKFDASFAGIFNKGFGPLFRAEMFEIATEMGEKIANPVKTVANIVVSGIQTVSSTLVDALISREWDGKEEGRSMGVAIREALKADLRNTIGQAIKDNMSQAIIAMIGIQDPQLAAIQAETSALIENTMTMRTLIQANMRLASAMVTGGSANLSVPNIIGIATAAAGGPTPGLGFGGPVPLQPFSQGGIVSRPVAALIGEANQSEAVVPLPNNRSIPVELNEPAGETVVINQSFDFRGANDATENRLRQFAAQIKKETIKELTDNINRGGSIAKVVGRR